MDAIPTLIQRAQKTAHGFADLQKAADEIVAGHTPAESIRIAKALFAADAHQARMLATFIFGQLAAHSRMSFKFLRERVSQDADWRVQEILAQAFNHYCADVGYEQALPVIREWLGAKNPNLRRAASEGLRIWTSRPYFREHPASAIQLLSLLRADESEYVRKSVGNALRDISRKHKDLIRAELKHWDVSDPKIKQTYQLASKFL